MTRTFDRVGLSENMRRRNGDRGTGHEQPFLAIFEMIFLTGTWHRCSEADRAVGECESSLQVASIFLSKKSRAAAGSVGGMKEEKRYETAPQPSGNVVSLKSQVLS